MTISRHCVVPVPHFFPHASISRYKGHLSRILLSTMDTCSSCHSILTRLLCTLSDQIGSITPHRETLPPSNMSAATAAKQRLDDLHQQLEAYKERLRQQEQDLKRLKVEMSQTRTVVQVTIPSEIGKASKEYAGTMYAIQYPALPCTSLLVLTPPQVILSVPRDKTAQERVEGVMGEGLHWPPIPQHRHHHRFILSAYSDPAGKLVSNHGLYDWPLCRGNTSAVTCIIFDMAPGNLTPHGLGVVK